MMMGMFWLNQILIPDGTENNQMALQVSLAQRNFSREFETQTLLNRYGEFAFGNNVVKIQRLQSWSSSNPVLSSQFVPCSR